MRHPLLVLCITPLQGYRKYISFEATDISTANTLPSKPKCGKSDSAGLQGSAPLLVREKGDMSATSHPSLTPSLVEEHAHSTFTNQVKHMKMLDRYPKSPLSSDAHRTSKNAENRKPELSTKWASKSFPSFVVCSVDKDSQKTKMPINSKKSLHQSQRQSQSKTKTALQLSSLGNKSMPAISLNGMATRSEFGHLLTHQDQVSFGSAIPGFRYETLCLQGHNTNRHNSHAPVTVVGPWISTPWLHYELYITVLFCIPDHASMVLLWDSTNSLMDLTFGVNQLTILISSLYNKLYQLQVPIIIVSHF